MITETSFEKIKIIVSIFFYQNSFYDEFFKKIENISIIKRINFVFIPTDITVEKLFSIKSLIKSKDIKISKMSENIKDKLNLEVQKER